MITTATATTTTAALVHPIGTIPEIRSRKGARRLSSPSTTQRPSVSLNRCQTLSLEALDNSAAFPIQKLASIRFLVLSYLADLERCLTEFESPTFDAWSSQKELTIDEATQWARTALEMLQGIRSDVSSHLPEFHLSDLSTTESFAFVKSHFPDMPDVSNLTEMLPGMTDMRSHLPDMRSRFPDMPSLPDLQDMRSHLTDMRVKLDDVRSRFNELDFHKPLSYIPTLSTHLQTLHSHLSTTQLPLDSPTISSFTPNTLISDLLDSLLDSELVKDILKSTPDVIIEGEERLERAAYEVANAVKHSFQGMQLISYSDLPKPWRNNPFVTDGYRFIPIERWPLIVMSLFTFHNETLNIHTHLIPFLLWGVNLIPLFNNSQVFDTPELLFMGFALLCLLSSTVWHTMSGCADHRSMDICARVDYVGIGWLISASVGTIVHYGFQCHPDVGLSFLVLSFTLGIAGNILPFMAWFNKYEYRFYRIIFFVALAFSGAGPIMALCMLHTWSETYEFITPVLPSFVSYLIGLVFYAAHFPERIIPQNIQRKLDSIGGNSHAIWHCFIVIAVSQHKAAIAGMKEGMQCTI